MDTILTKPSSHEENVVGRYEKLNLKENPFPTTPTINSESPDKRYNGEIYEGAIRENEMKKIEDNFLKVSQNDFNHLRIGYILDTSYVGRGNGKSSFSINLLKNINNKYCLDFSYGQNKCFGLYISPEPSGRTKSFYSLIDLIFQVIINTNIIEYCLASIRLEGLISIYSFDYKSEFKGEEEIIKNLNDQNWFDEKKFDLHKISSTFKTNTYLNLLPPEFPIDKATLSLWNQKIKSKSDFFDYYYHTIKKGKERIDFIFNDLVNFFLGSGFNGAYIIIDDFERIPDFQSDRQKRDFALELRTNFFDGMSQNAKRGFYNVFLMLHAGVPRLIEKAWSESGLEQRSPISGANVNVNHLILFEKLNPTHAELLLKKYLNEFRINKDVDDLAPFTKEAVTRIGEISEYNAAGILQKANILIENAIKFDKTKIDIDFVNRILFEKHE